MIDRTLKHTQNYTFKKYLKTQTSPSALQLVPVLPSNRWGICNQTYWVTCTSYIANCSRTILRRSFARTARTTLATQRTICLARRGWTLKTAMPLSEQQFSEFPFSAGRMIEAPAVNGTALSGFFLFRQYPFWIFFSLCGLEIAKGVIFLALVISKSRVHNTSFFCNGPRR